MYVYVVVGKRFVTCESEEVKYVHGLRKRGDWSEKEDESNKSIYLISSYTKVHRVRISSPL